MEYTGRIMKLLPTRSGISQRTGNKWKSLPFVFEYYEHENDRFSDKVYLETLDTAIMEKIGQFVEKDANGQAVVLNGEIKMTQNIEVRCGFGHSIRQYDGKFYNEVKLYRMEVLTQATNNADGGNYETAVPAGDAPELNSFEELQTNTDNLPF